ncbi:aldehyde dehydrogenase family protein [Nocardioides marmoribigeumensis]|uniref:Betaine-aldehyde dehydrogenase n=1 Tax=Nocardioides marmoribigeumensis TaxID=433649 RepID=A0ABU2BUW5_9ACTN|nr:aldehyde dehydrogenase family protein [Nocardioides marmoribigeumensis]MDR7362423.1 betaine-aldehyde dehydrogenase [Nocardioides marmoribigeumensis]
MTDTFVRPDWTPLDLPRAEQSFCVTNGDRFDTTDPTTGEVVASLTASTLEDVAGAVERARAAFGRRGWRNDGQVRCRVLFRYAEALRANRERLAELLTREQGKTLAESRNEIEGSADMVEFYAGLARSTYGRAIPVGDDAHSVILREPLGVVGVITPWNWPVVLLMRALAPALAAGNTVVVKPASLTPAVTVECLALLAADPDLPEGVLTCVLGSGAVVGDALVTNRHVEMIAFTGESGTGINVLKQAANDLRKVSLELGGKSPNIVFADADLDKALDGAVNAAFTTSGQICTAGSRLLLEDSIYEDFLARLTERVRALRLGDPLDPTTQMGPVVSRSQQTSVNGYVELGRAEGKLLVGDDLDDTEALRQGCYVAPAIVTDLPRSSRVVQEEIFGPVLVVQRFSGEAEAIEIAEDSQFGLAAGIWTSDLNRAWRVGRAVSSGTIWINTYHHFYPEAEVGGFRQSGLGRQQGLEGIHEFTETKHLNFDSKSTLF